jgi:hypothetical protein
MGRVQRKLHYSHSINDGDIATQSEVVFATQKDGKANDTHCHRGEWENMPCYVVPSYNMKK